MLLFLLLVLCLSPFTVSSEPVAKDAVVPVAAWRWVTVVNPSPISQKFSNGRAPLGKGDTCAIESGGHLKVLAIEDNDVLLTYTAPGNPMGTPCPSGVLTVLSIATVNSMIAGYPAHQAERCAIESRLRRLLALAGLKSNEIPCP